MADFVDLSDRDILVVEDDEMNFIYLQQIFKLTRGNITRAKNGKEALSYARENKYDIILMDIQLPDISGNEVTYEIRKYNTNTPIIAQTASRSPDENEECLAAGCSDLLIKPFTIDQFSELLAKYL